MTLLFTGHVIFNWYCVYHLFYYMARCSDRNLCAQTRILPASTLRNLTSLQPVRINALRKSRALIGCCHIKKTPPAVHVIVRHFIPNSTQRRISTLNYDISTLSAISHRHIGADVDYVRSTASDRITDQSLVHQREESSSQK
jgi:hypothetical protein